MAVRSGVQERNAFWKELSFVVNIASSSKLEEERWKSVCLSSHFKEGEHGFCIGRLPISWNGLCGDWIRVVFQIGPLKVTEEREKIDWRGLEMIWGNNCFLRLRDKIEDYNFKNKTKQINEVASLFCNTRGRPGLHFNPVSLTKIVSRQSHIINFLRWLRGLLHLFCLTLTSSLSVIS